ncbi:MAG: carboxypeptidase regulatory-like domain-containing protein [Pyrinomonadaceae bacterium]
MRKTTIFLFAISLIVIAFTAITFGQTSGSINGTVSDPNGAVVPGATIMVKGNAGQTYKTTSAGNGTFNIPSVATGVYEVTIAANGFQTFVSKDVKVDVGLPSSVTTSLIVGNPEETVVVTSGGDIIQSQTATVGTTLTGRTILETPITSRDALDLVTLLPGTTQVGRPRQSSINGLPKGSLSISIDGVDVQDNLLKSSDGFFTFIRPRLDSIEEVTVANASTGAESGGDGAVQIKFVTKRGNNDYHGGLFWQHRDQGLNSNYWWNNRNGLPRNPIVLNQYGGNASGPIPFPLFGDNGGPKFSSGKDKAFFFVNYEEFRIPESINRTRTLLTQDAMNGIFRYGANSVDLYALAGMAGLPNTVDPTIGSLMSAIRSSTSQGTVTATTGNPNTENLNIISRTSQKRTFLTTRFDVNLTKNHAFEFVFNRQIFRNVPSDLLNNADPSFPGFPNTGGQNSDRFSQAFALRSSFTNSLINEVRFARLYGDSTFRPGLTRDQFANQNFYNLNFNTGGFGLTNVTAGNAGADGFSRSGSTDNRRSSPSEDFTDNVTWLKGSHSFNFGGQYKRVRVDTASINQLVPEVGFGVDISDTAADTAFRNSGANANLPGATAAQLAQAKSLYALLTGRVTTYTNTAYLKDDGTYEIQGDQFQAGTQTTYGLYAQDIWRARPNLTISFGVRWQPQDAFSTRTGNFSYARNFSDVYGVSGEGNLFKPGTLTGQIPTFEVLPIGSTVYNADKNNFAPSFGVVWSPSFGDKGAMAKIFGSNGSSVFRGGFSRSFVRDGTNVALTILSNAPGAILNNASLLVSQGTLPVGTLLQNLGSVTLPTVPSTPPAVITGSFNDTIVVVNPNIKSGYVDSYSFGYQRELGKDMAIEIRYVGNRARDLWRLYNIDEINVSENGFANEFRLAQANFAANNLAGGSRAGSYAFFGAGTGTSPLPILQAYYSGVTAANAGNAALYTSALYRNATLTNLLNPINPNARTFAGTIENSNARRNNALTAGLPINFFYVNPTTLGGGNFIYDNAAESSYNALQVEFRRRLSRGLLVQGSYTFSKSLTDAYASSSIVQSNFRSLRDRNLNNTVSPFDVTHAFKVNWLYELPFGKGASFFNNAGGLLDALIGGWGINGSIKLQSGTPINFGNVDLVGLDRRELEKLIGVYYSQSVSYSNGTPVIATASYLPADIISNTSNAFANLPFTGRAIVPAGFNGCIQEYVGQCGSSNLVVHGPKFFRTDLSLSKKFRIGETRNIEFRASAFNALNNPQWRVGGFAADVVNVTAFGNGWGQLTNGTVYQDTSTTNDQGGRTIEFALRIKL